MHRSWRDRQAQKVDGAIIDLARETGFRSVNTVGLQTLAEFARASRYLLRAARFSRPEIPQRTRAPSFREICFSRANQNVAVGTKRSRRRANVRLRLHRVCGVAKCTECGFPCGSCART